MSSRLVQTPLALRQSAAAVASRRGLAASAQTAKLPAVVAPSAQTSKLGNGVTVISAEATVDNSPLATVGILVRAGSRYEGYGNAGSSHALRQCAGMASNRFPALLVTRTMQHFGGALQVAQGREHLMYATQVDKRNVEEVIDFLMESVGAQSFMEWEVGTALQRMNFELAEMEPAARVQDLLHRAAFRTGLGNSIYTPERMAGKHTPAMLRDFLRQTFTGPRVAVVGLGVDHKRMASYAEQLKVGSGEGPKGDAKFYGGEERLESDTGGRALVALGTGISGVSNIQEAVAGLILQRVWGQGSPAYNGDGAGKLQKAAGAADGTDVQAFNLTYSDAGLIGVMVAADAKDAGKAVSSVAAALRDSTISEEEVASAKKSLLVDAYRHLLHDSLARAEDLGLQALLRPGGEMTQAAQAPDLINGVQLGDVQALAKKVSGAKMAMASFGDLSTVPYVDSL